MARRQKKKRRIERKQQPWGHRDKWENHGDPNLHFANEETRSKKNISNVESDLVSISDDLLNEKKEILSLYKSQTKVIDNFDHIYKYEMWYEYGGK